jgi:hypothetical protein
VELDELHVDEVGARPEGHRVTVAGVLPGVRRDGVGLADPAGREDDRRSLEHDELPALAPVGDRARDPLAVLEQPVHGALHEHVDAEVHGVLLERADHLEAGPVADVREARVAVAAEVALQDAPVLRPVEERAPALQLEHAVRRLLRVELAMRQWFSIFPPRMVSRKWTCQLSSGHTLRSAAAMPPSAMTVCALPRRDLHTMAVRTPWLAASMAARRPAPPAPITTTCTRGPRAARARSLGYPHS